MPGETEQALQAGEGVYGPVYGHMQGVLCLAAPDWRRVHYLSPSYETIWGRPRQEVYLRPLAWLEGVAREEGEIIRARLSQLGAGGGQGWDLPEFRLQRPDGQVRWVRAWALPLLDPRGHIHQQALLAEDVTEGRNWEARLEEVKTVLAVAQAQGREEREALVLGVLANVQRLVLPCVERLKAGRLDDEHRTLLVLLEASLTALISPFARKLTYTLAALTPRELEVAQMVRDGRNNVEIADLLNISENAVAFHRQNIRSKLGLKKQKINLRTYLQDISAE